MQYLEFLLLIVPSLAVMAVAWWAGRSGEQLGARRRLLLLLAGADLLVALLASLIWFNPYGRSISSSLAAFGVLPALVALLILLLTRPGDWVETWRKDPILLIILLILLLAAFAFLYLAETSAFFLVVGLTAGLGIVWWVGTRPGLALPALLGAVALCFIFLGSGWLYLPGATAPTWLRTALFIAAGLSMVLCIFLAAALVYTALRTGQSEAPSPQGVRVKHAGPRLALALLLVLGSAYYVLWDGIWSSAHARAFEDHLPFMQFLFSLLAGLVIFFLLRGRRRLAGPLYTLLVTVACTFALAVGWRISAFEITEHRARRLDAALHAYQADHGSYPQSIGELSPRYLPIVLPPVVVSSGNWCYQGGGDAYRLGYISGEFTYFESAFFVETYAQSGDAGQADPVCDDLVRRLQAGGMVY
jgi:hypothetical protein